MKKMTLVEAVECDDAYMKERHKSPKQCVRRIVKGYVILDQGLSSKTINLEAPELIFVLEPVKIHNFCFVLGC